MNRASEPKVVYFNLRNPNTEVVHKAVGPYLTACGTTDLSVLVTTGAPVTCRACLAHEDLASRFFGE